MEKDNINTGDNTEVIEEKDTEQTATEELNPLELLQKELAELTDKHLRLIAEYDNFRKRTVREKETMYPEAVASTLKGIVPIVDNFDRAVNAATEDQNYKKGVEMTYQSLLAVLEKLGVTSFGEIGDSFDPNIHNAVMVCEDSELPSDSVADVLQKGYRIGERVLRVAMVKVVA